MTIYTTPEAFADTTPSAGGRLGASLGTGISSGLKMLLEGKIKKMHEREKLNQLRSILGGADVPGDDIQADFLDSARTDSPKRGLTNDQILAVSQIDPNLAKIIQSQKESFSKEEASKFKETKDVRKEIRGQARAARENNMRLDRMSKLNESGKLISAGYNELLKKFGLDVPILKNPASQEFDKLSNDMFRNIREIFGARITNLEVDAFLKTIPTLSNTKEGRIRIIKNLKALNEGASLRLKAMNEIIKENRGVPPYNLGEQIEERISPELDKLSTRFVEGEPTPTSSSLQENEVIMIDPQGRRRAVTKKDVQAAKKAGYKLSK
jgi:hypothetical protein